jgi:hypothetical protein
MPNRTEILGVCPGGVTFPACLSAPLLPFPIVHGQRAYMGFGLGNDGACWTDAMDIPMLSWLWRLPLSCRFPALCSVAVTIPIRTRMDANDVLFDPRVWLVRMLLRAFAKLNQQYPVGALFPPLCMRQQGVARVWSWVFPYSFPRMA